MTDINKELLNEKLSGKIKKIRLVLLDTDGVLTDGSIFYDDAGREYKRFSVRDGLGLRLLMDCGMDVGIITGRASKALFHRCRDLGISLVMEGIREKDKALDEILEKTGYKNEEVAFVGDDLLDIPVMKKAGLAVAVADAHDAVIKIADIVLSAKGGAGAVRQLCEIILKEQGFWQKIEKRFSII